MKWFRFYAEALNDRKVQSLPGDLFKAWVNILCLYCNEGAAIDLSSISFALRAGDSKAEAIVDDLLNRGLLDDTAAGLVPHNWNNRQYKSDVSNERVKRHRKRPCNVTVTPPDTDTDSEPNGSDASASGREALWGNGVTALIALGVSETRAKPMIGRWLKDAGDDFERVMRAISRARSEAPIDPIAWITAALKAEGGKSGKTGSVIAAADRLVERIRSFDEPAPAEGSLRIGTGPAPVRSISQR